MALRRQHPGDAECAQLFRRILHALDLKPDVRQPLEDRRQVRIGIEMRLEPAQRELHAPTPPLSVGTSSAEQPSCFSQRRSQSKKARTRSEERRGGKEWRRTLKT